MKTLRATSNDKSCMDKYYDVPTLRKLDEEQGRERLTGTEVDAVISLSVARQLITDANEYLQRFAKKTGQFSATRTAEAMLRKAIGGMRDKISGEQLISIANNINDCGIYLSSNPLGIKQCLNIQRTALNHIINQATKQCGMECSCTRDESKMCQLRYALDQVPGVKSAARGNWVSGNNCPYQFFEVNERDGE